MKLKSVFTVSTSLFGIMILSVNSKHNTIISRHSRRLINNASSEPGVLANSTITNITAPCPQGQIPDGTVGGCFSPPPIQDSTSISSNTALTVTSTTKEDIVMTDTIMSTTTVTVLVGNTITSNSTISSTTFAASETIPASTTTANVQFSSSEFLISTEIFFATLAESQTTAISTSPTSSTIVSLPAEQSQIQSTSSTTSSTSSEIVLSTYTIIDSSTSPSTPSAASNLIVSTPIGNQQQVSFNTDSAPSTFATSTPPLATTSIPDLSLVDAQAQSVVSIPLAIASPSSLINSGPSSIVSAPTTVAFETAMPTILASGQQAKTTLASNALKFSCTSASSLILLGLLTLIVL